MEVGHRVEKRKKRERVRIHKGSSQRKHDKRAEKNRKEKKNQRGEKEKQETNMIMHDVETKKGDDES